MAVESEVVAVGRVSHTKAGGRVSRYQAVAIAGDREGRLGWGAYKAATVGRAKEGASRRACSRLVQLPLRDGYFPHDFVLEGRGVKLHFKSYSGVGRMVAKSVLASYLSLGGMRGAMVRVYGRPSLMRLLDELTRGLASMRPALGLAAVRDHEELWPKLA